MSSITIGYAPKVDTLPAHQPENPLWRSAWMIMRTARCPSIGLKARSSAEADVALHLQRCGYEPTDKPSRSPPDRSQQKQSSTDRTGFAATSSGPSLNSLTPVDAVAGSRPSHVQMKLHLNPHVHPKGEVSDLRRVQLAQTGLLPGAPNQSYKAALSWRFVVRPVVRGSNQGSPGSTLTHGFTARMRRCRVGTTHLPTFPSGWRLVSGDRRLQCPPCQKDCPSPSRSSPKPR